MIAWKFKHWRTLGVAATSLGLAACGEGGEATGEGGAAGGEAGEAAQGDAGGAAPAASGGEAGEAARGESGAEHGEAGVVSAYAGLSGDQLTLKTLEEDGKKKAAPEEAVVTYKDGTISKTENNFKMVFKRK